MTDWLVYRCDACRTTIYVNARHADAMQTDCGHVLRLVDLADEHQMCEVLRLIRR